MNNETPRRIEARRGFSLFYKGKTLLSLIDPEGQADRAADAVPKTGRTLYFCPSPLYGYGLARLLEGIGDDSAVLCVETDQKLMDLSLKTIPRSLWDCSRLRIIRTGDTAALCAYVREAWGSRSFRRVETLRLSGGWQLDPERYETMAAALRRDIATDWGNAMTLVKLGRRYIRNALRNLTLIPQAHTIGDLDYGDTPILVLGAGPSLDTVLESLAGSSGEKRPFKIICVDTALAALRARDIKPDLTVALESQHWNLRDFIGLGGWELSLAMDLSALPATGGLPGTRTFLFVTPWTDLRIFDRLKAAGLFPETLPPLGSVGLSATALALRCSSGPVITGGMDFSFTPDAFHARSTPGHLEQLRRQNRLRGLINAGAAFRRGVFKTRSKSGLPVRSDPSLKTYRDLFEREFASENRLRDITGSGLPLGIGTVTMEEALALLEGADRPPAEGSAQGSRDQGRDRAPRGTSRKLEGFIRRERDTLIMIRDILGGGLPAPREQLDKLLDEGNYLWAHFPDCAGTDRRPADISFLKRVRAEIDPFIGLFDLLIRELGQTAAPYRRDGP
jgi:hypothetical protein